MTEVVGTRDETLRQADRSAAALAVAKQRDLAAVFGISPEWLAESAEFDALIRELMQAYRVADATMPDVRDAALAWSRSGAHERSGSTANWADAYATSMKAAERLVAVATSVVRRVSPLLEEPDTGEFGGSPTRLGGQRETTLRGGDNA